MDSVSKEINGLLGDNEEDRVLSFDGTQKTPSQTLPQFRPTSGSAGNNSGRMRRNGSMRRSLLFVSGSGMQLTSPNTPYLSNNLNHSSDAILSGGSEQSVPMGRDRARSYGSEFMLNGNKSPELSTVRNSEETNHPLIVTKNSTDYAHRVLTPTPSAVLDSQIKTNASNGSSSKTHVRRVSSFSNRSLLVAPAAGGLPNLTHTPARVDEKENYVKNHELKNEKEYTSTESDDETDLSSSVKKASLVHISESEDSSSELLSKLAAKEAKILETKSELDDLKKLMKQKEEQLKEEQVQLEFLKQEMALKLLKTHHNVPEDINQVSNNKLQFNNVSESVTSIFGKTRKTAQTLVTNVNNSLDNKQEPTETEKLMSTSFEQELQFPMNNFEDEDDDNLDDVIYSLNSPVKKTQAPNHVIKEEQIDDDPLDLNFKPKSESLVQESVQTQRNFNNNRKPQRSKSRMSIYFNKTVSLMSQFDQMLQSELEKKMGINEEDELEQAEKLEDPEDQVYDLPPKPDEIDTIEANAGVKKQHTRSLSSYKFFG
ncbi:hypothetical protein QEN19_002486 [Hanseniaspora menglaensis]